MHFYLLTIARVRILVSSFNGRMTSEMIARALPRALLIIISFDIRANAFRMTIIVYFRPSEKAVDRSLASPIRAIRTPFRALHYRQFSHNRYLLFSSIIQKPTYRFCLISIFYKNFLFRIALFHSMFRYFPHSECKKSPLRGYSLSSQA